MQNDNAERQRALPLYVIAVTRLLYRLRLDAADNDPIGHQIELRERMIHWATRLISADMGTMLKPERLDSYYMLTLLLALMTADYEDERVGAQLSQVAYDFQNSPELKPKCAVINDGEFAPLIAQVMFKYSSVRWTHENPGKIINNDAVVKEAAQKAPSPCGRKVPK